MLEEKLLRNRLDMVNKRDMLDGMNQKSDSERVGEKTKSSSMLQSFLGTESVSFLDIPSQQEALVRKLDALGVALTDDVINKACLSMLMSAIPTHSSSQSTNSHNSSNIANTDKMCVVPTVDTSIKGSDMTNNYLASIDTNGTEHTGQRRTRDNNNEKGVEIEGQPFNKRSRSSSQNHVSTEGTEGSTDGDQTLVADDSEGPDDEEDEEGESDIEHRRKMFLMGAGNNMHVANIILS